MEGYVQRLGKGMSRRLAVVLGSAALVLSLAAPVGQRTAGAVARYLLAMAAMATATPARAQVQDAYVSTLEQTPQLVSQGYGDLVQTFTTGGRSGGYPLGSIRIGYADTEDSRFSAYIYQPSGRTCRWQSFGSSCRLTLTFDGSFEPGVLTFRAPANTELEANTTYEISLLAIADGGGITSSVSYSVTTSSDEDTGGVDGWSIDELRDFSGQLFQTGGELLESKLVMAVEPPQVNTLLRRVEIKNASNDSLEYSRFAHPPLDGITRFVMPLGGPERVGYGVRQITIETERANNNTSLAILDGSDRTLSDANRNKDGFQANVGLGTSTFKIRITAPGGFPFTTYTLQLRRRRFCEEQSDCLVSNLDQSSRFDGTHRTGVGQSFRTGNSASGYLLDGVYLDWRGGNTTFTAEVWSCTGTDCRPNQRLATLAHPANLRQGRMLFTPSSPLRLEPNRSYAVTFKLNVSYSASAFNPLQYFLTASTSEDPGRSSGWTLANNALIASESQNDTWYRSENKLRIAVMGRVAPSRDVGLRELALTGRVSYAILYDNSEARAFPVELAPAFSSGTTDYTAAMPFGAYRRITVTARPANANASITVLDADDNPIERCTSLEQQELCQPYSRLTNQGGAFEIAVGNGHVFKLKVTAEDGDTSRTYTVSRVAQSVESRPAFVGGPRIRLDPLDSSRLRVDPHRDIQGIHGALRIRWVRVDADGTSNEEETTNAELSYTPTVADAGRRIRVRVSFTDRNGDPQTLYSAAWPASGTVTAFDTKLVALSLADASGGEDAEGADVPLRPAFDPQVTSYRANVGNTVEKITVAAAQAAPESQVRFLDGDGAELTDADQRDGFQTLLQVGDNTIRVQVSNRDGTAMDTTTLTVRRAATTDSTDTTLSGLTLANAANATPLPFTPAFAPTTDSYRAEDVGHGVRRITVTTETTHPNATVAVRNGYGVDIRDRDAAATGHQIDLLPDENTFLLQVTAEDGVTTATYRLTMNRGAPAGTPGMPQNLTATPGDSLVRFAWDPPSDSGSSPIINYEIVQFNVEGVIGSALPSHRDWSFSSIYPGDDPDEVREFLLTASNGEPERFWVRAVNAAGPGPAATISVTPSPVACAAPAFGGRRALWESTLTMRDIYLSVGFFAPPIGRGFYEGASTSGWFNSSRSFAIGADWYAVSRLYVNNDGNLLFAANPALGDHAALLKLHLCGTETSLAGLTPDGDGIYNLGSSGLDWSLLLNRKVALSLPANRPAAGTPLIEEDGNDLNVNTAAVTDADGLPASFNYQWMRLDEDGTNPVEIPGATAAVYTPVFVDYGKKLQVRVSFPDLLGGQETLTSAPYPSAGTVTAPTSCAAPDFGTRRHIWTGRVTVGHTPGEYYGYDDDGHDNGGSVNPGTFTIGADTYTIQGVAVIDDGSSSFYFNTTGAGPLPSGARLHVCDTALDIGDASQAIDSWYRWADANLDWSGESERMVHLSLPANQPATGAPRIRGEGSGTSTAALGDPLYVYTDRITDADGLGSFSYQWVRVGADGVSNPQDVEGATGWRYFPMEEDVGSRLLVRVTFFDQRGNQETLESSAYPTGGNTIQYAPCPAPDLAGRTVIWTGTMAIDLLEAGGLTIGRGYNLANHGTTGYLDNTNFTIGRHSYQIQQVLLDTDDVQSLVLSRSLPQAEREELQLHVCDATYRLDEARRRTTGTARTFYEWDAGYDDSNLFGYWGDIARRTLWLSRAANNPATGLPVISGGATTGNTRVGTTLTVDTNAVMDADGRSGSFTYQWVRVDPDGISNPQDIQGATSRSYTLTPQDAGGKVQARVSFTDRRHYRETLQSTPYPSGEGNRIIDTTLEDLALLNTSPENDTDTPITYAPAFAPHIPDYNVQVGMEVTRITVTATRNVPGQVIDYRIGADVGTDPLVDDPDGEQVELEEGENLIRILVDAGLGDEPQIYRLAVTRANSPQTQVSNADANPNAAPSANQTSQAFTTGDNPGGYVLSSIVLKGGDFSNANGNTVTLRSDSRTGDRAANFTAAASADGSTLTLTPLTGSSFVSLTEDGLTMTPNTTVTLAASTTYVMVTGDNLGSATWDVTANPPETLPSGWSIAENRESLNLNNGTWTTNSAVHQFSVVATAINLPAITIDADRATASAWTNKVTYTLRRSGPTTAELEATVVFSGPEGNNWGLEGEHTVTFAANSATATLERHMDGSDLGIGLSDEATGPGLLTAAVAGIDGYVTEDTAEVALNVLYGKQWLLGFAEEDLLVAEDGGTYSLTVQVRQEFISNNLDVPNIPLPFELSTSEGQADPGLDFEEFAITDSFQPSDCARDAEGFAVCAKTVTFTILDDDVVESGRALVNNELLDGVEEFSINARNAPGESPRRFYPEHVNIFIRDNELGLVDVRVTSTPLQNPAGLVTPDTYGAREHIEFTAGFNTPVTTVGYPTFTFNLGGTEKTATYFKRGNFNREYSDALVFSYAVRGGNSGDLDTDGISWDANAFSPGSILIADTDDPPLLHHEAQTDLLRHRVNGRSTTRRADTATVTDISITSTPERTSPEASTPDTYGAGEDIEITVTFNQNVAVEGDPRFKFFLLYERDLGEYDWRFAEYSASRSTSNKLVFVYTVKPGDVSENSIWIGGYSSNPHFTHTFQVGSDDRIRVAANNVDVSLSHSEQGQQADHKVDGSQGAVAGVAVTSTAPRYREAGGANPRDIYGAGDVIRLTVSFTNRVVVDTTGGVPTLTFSLGGMQTRAHYDGGSSTDQLTFSHTVQATDADDNGIFLLNDDADVNGGALQLNGATLSTAAGGAVNTTVSTRGNQGRHRVDGSRSGPYVTSLAVTSNPMVTSESGRRDTYGVGETIAFTLGMSEAVTVTGAPHLQFKLGTANRNAAYNAEGSTATGLVFTYVVQSADLDSDGIELQDGEDVSGSTSAVVLDSGATVVAVADNSRHADLVNPGRGRQSLHKVDGSLNAASTPEAGGPSITGIPQVGQPLTVGLGAIGDTDGLPAAFPEDYRFAWRRLDPETGQDNRLIGSFDGVNTYVPTAEDLGRRLKVDVYFQDNGGNDEVRTSAATAVVTAAQSGATAQDSEVTTEEDTFYTFQWSDFNVPPTFPVDNTGTRVVVTSLPDAGRGYVYHSSEDYRSTANNLPEVVWQDNLIRGYLRYRPPADANGDNFASFRFRVNDGTGYSVDEYTMTIHVTPVNDAPRVAIPTTDQTARADAEFTLTIPDDAFIDVDGDTLTYGATRSDDSDLPSWLTFNAATRTFTGTPGAEQVGALLAVKLTARDDSDATGSDTFNIRVLAATGQPYVNIYPTTGDLIEGDAFAYTVTLNTLPANDVTIRPTSGDSGAVGVSPPSLVFTTANWTTAQTVTVMANSDDDTNDETVTISHSVSGYGAVSIGDVVTISVTDAKVGICERTPAVRDAIVNLIDDVTDCAVVTVTQLGRITETLGLAAAGLSTLKEGDFAGLSNLQGLNLFSNNLSSLPENIFAGLSNLQELGLHSNNLTSLPENIFAGLSNLQRLWLDNNSLRSLDANIFAGLSNLQRLDFYSNNLSSLPENIFAGLSNLQRLQLGDNHLTSLPEDIFTGLFTLRALHLGGNHLTRLPQDIFDGLRNLTTLQLALNGLKCMPRSLPWDRLAEGELSLDATRPPDCFGVNLSVAPAEVTEGNDGEITVTATLTAGPRLKPGEDTRVSVSVAGRTATEGTDFMAVDNNFAITIPFGSASATGTFTLTATADTEEEPGGETVLVSGRSTVTFVSSFVERNYTAPVGSATVTIRDDSEVRVDPATLIVAEAGSGVYTLVLDSLPPGAVTITPASGDTDAVSVSPASLTFSTANWDRPQTVAVTSAQDDDANNETVTISHGVSGYDTVTAAPAVTVTVTDNDTAGVSVSTTSVADLNEGGTATYTVKLDTEPSGNVTITPTSGDSGAVSVSPASLVFTTATWNTPQTVSVTGVQDDDANGETVTISHGVSGYDTVTAAPAVTVTVTDNDTAGVSVSTTSVADLNEGGTATYTLKLDTEPSGNVTITPTSGDSGAVSVSPASLVFTTATWNTPQTVSVAGVQDDDANGETVTISHSVGGYGSVSVGAVVTISVTDDDTAGVSLSTAMLTVGEESSGTYTVTLNTQPAGNVTISPSSGDSGAVSVEPASLIFTTTNWDTAQTVSITAVDDPDTASETVTISHDVSGYGDVSVGAVVTVTVTDNDTAGVSVSTATLTVGEESNGTYTVTLNTQPSGPVTISPSSGDSGAVSVEPASLTFTTTNWDTAQTVSVTAVDDPDTASETVTVSHSVSGYDALTSAAAVTVTVTDNDTTGVSLSTATLTVDEESSGTYTVTLNTQPSGPVTISPGSSDSEAVGVEPASLTFTTTNWDTAQTVSITAVDDPDTAIETVTISHSVSGYDALTSAAAVTVSVTDNDTAGVSVSAATLTVGEENSGTYTVTLNTQPSGPVTINPSSGDSGAVGVEPASLTFTTTNWDTAQTVSVTAVDDPDTASETVTISHSVSGYDALTSAAAVTVTVTDNDTAGVSVSTATLTVGEESNGTYTVTLNTQPSGPVTISPGSGDSGAVSVEPASLTFTTINWDTAQTVSVTSVVDDDANDETVTISHSVSGYGSVTANSVTVSVTDNDTAGVSVSTATLTVGEENSGTYTVMLNTQPSGPVTISPGSSDSEAVGVEPASLTFTTTNWDTAQTVSITAVDDPDTASETVTISHNVSGYGSVTANSVTVSVTDNDTAGVSVSAATLTVDEENSGTYTVTLNTQPSGPVTINPSSGDSGAVGVEPASLTFTTTNWDTAQTVSVTAVDDPDTASETVTISHGVSGYDALTSAAAVTVTVTDNDTAGVSVSAATLTVGEESNGLYTVTLNTQPSGPVTINPSSGDSGAVSVEPASLTFTTTNWNTPQTVTLTGVNDSNGISETVTISHSVSGYDTLTSAAAVTVTVTDNDTAGVSVSTATLTVGEENSGTYTVTLNTQPSGPVTISPGSGDSGAVSVEPASLTFTTINWDTAQTVSVTSVVDDDANDETVTISHSVSGYGSVTANSVTVSVTDNDTAGVSLSTATLTVDEESSGTYTVTLNTQPSGPVTISPGSSDSEAVGVEPASLTFTTTNWDTAQTVSVTAVDDPDTASETVTISHSVSGYGSVTANSVTVSVTDNDTAGVSVSTAMLTVDEENSGTYTVTLNTQPSGPVTINPSSGDSGAVGVEPASLTFTTTNWDTAQTVSVTAVDDPDTASETVTISHDVSGYDALTSAAAVTVTVTDNDTAGVSVSAATLTVGEESSGTYTVTLNTLPSGPVTISPSSSDSDALSVSPATLTFTTANWNTPQTVTLTGVNDSNGISETVTISHGVSGYGGVTANSVTVSVTDNDTAGVSVSTATLTVGEENSGTYSVTLNTQPSGPVTISPGSGDSGAVSVEPASLTFTTINWDTAQTVSVTSVVDDDANDETVTISHSVSGYGSVTANSVTVSVTDNDTAGVSLSTATLTVDEESSGTYTVTLNTQPSGPVTISPGSSDSEAVGVEPASLTFTTTNWDTAQTVSVTAVDDPDTASETVTISHSISGYGSVTANSVTVSVTDNDTAGVSVSAATLTVGEENSGTYTVTLNTQPSGPVTINPSSGDSGAVGVEPASLTFTTTNWDTAQTVSVTAVDDPDTASETVTISHGVSGYDALTSAAAVTVTVTDNDTAGVSVSAATLTVGEESSGTYTVTLNTLPSGPVTISPSSSDSDALSVSPATLTFTTANWNTPQTVTLTGVNDSNGISETVTISHSVSGYGSISIGDVVTISVTDDDNTLSESNLNNGSQGVTLSETSLTMDEGGTGTYTVVLDTQPTGGVTVTPSRSDNNRDVTVSGAITFSTSNWDTAQTVTVNAAEDDDTNDDMTTITHFVSGADYVFVTAASVGVIVTDDDTHGITVSETTLSLNEGSTLTYTVELATLPAGNVTISPGSGDSDAVSVSPASLVFTTANWNTPQTVSVTAAVDDDTNNEMVTISHDVSGYGSVSIGDVVTVSVTDTDIPDVTMTPPTVSITGPSGAVSEGSTLTFTLNLNEAATSDLTVAVTLSETGDMVTEANEGLRQVTVMQGQTQATFTVATENDDVAEINGTVTALVVADTFTPATYEVGSVNSVTVSVTDNDTAGVSVEPTSLSPSEGGTSSYTLALTSAPTGNVTITPSSGDSDAVSVSPASLVFTTANWNTPQTVSVTAAVDDDTNNETVTISHHVSGYGSVSIGDVVTVSVTDTDTLDVTMTAPTVSITGPSVAMSEGSTLTFTLTLDEAAPSELTVGVTLSETGDMVTEANEELRQVMVTQGQTQATFTVATENDDVTEPDRIVTALVETDSATPATYEVGSANSVAVSVTDDDGTPPATDTTAPMVDYTAPTALTVDTAITAITPITRDGDIASYDATGLPTGLSIDAATGEISGTPTMVSTAPATVVVTVMDNAGNSTTVTLLFPSVAAAVQPGLGITPSSLSFNEGGTLSYSVTLNTLPVGNVTITPSSGDSDVVRVEPASLVFTPSTWDTPRTVSVTAQQDTATANETVTISHGVSGYDSLTVADAVTVSVTAATQATTEDNQAATREAEAQEEAEAVLNEVVVPDMVQQLAARTTEDITSRLNSIASGAIGGLPTITLDDALADTFEFFYGQRQRLKDEGSLEWRQAISGRTFAFPLSGLSLAQGDGDGGQGQPFSSLAVWGGADYFGYGNSIEGTDVDGNGFSAVMGIDLQPMPQLVSGLAMTTSRWGLDYTTDGTNGATAKGTYKVGVTVLNPYLNWSATEQLSLWATFGYGRGEVEQTPEDGDATTRTGGLTSWAGGARFEVLSGMEPGTGEGSPLGLAFKVDGATSSFLDSQVQLARLAAELSRSFSTGNGLLSTAVELGWTIRSVSGKNDPDPLQERIADKNHSGDTELATSLNWLSGDGSLSATVDTRVLLGGGDRKEWGMGGHLRFAPSRQDGAGEGEGLTVSLQPSFGVTGTRLNELWSLSGDGELAINDNPPGARLDAQLAYSFRHNEALFTPYTELTWEDATTTYGAGLRYHLNTSLELDLKGVRRNPANGDPENRLSLDVHAAI